MKLKSPILLSVLAFATLGAAQDAPRDQPSAKSQERIIKEVGHKLRMLPYVGPFDYTGKAPVSLIQDYAR